MVNLHYFGFEINFRISIKSIDKTFKLFYFKKIWILFQSNYLNLYLKKIQTGFRTKIYIWI